MISGKARQRRASSGSARSVQLQPKLKKVYKHDSLTFLWIIIGATVAFLFGTPLFLLKVGLDANRARLRGKHEDIKEDETKYHVVFSTDCSDYHNWQSYVLFYHAEKIGQPGTITRIASGCSAKQTLTMRDFHYHYVESISPRFKTHFTPSYSDIDGDHFPYFNKPFGLRHWMEHALGFPHADDDDAVIILIDPDMILLRPITRYFQNSTDRWNHGGLSKVIHGHPVAQKYLLSPQWLQWNLTTLLGSKTPASQLSRDDAIRSFQLGPPYIATTRDMWKLAKRWTELCIEVKKVYPQMLAEMYAYILAAADLNIVHTVSHSLMWSDPKVQYSEPWDWVESMDTNVLCEQMPSSIANVLHYCQPFSLGDWAIFKTDLRGRMHKCSHPLLAEPSRSDIVNYDMSSVHPLLLDRRLEKQHEWAERVNKREAFMLCHVIKKLNEAMEHHRSHACKGNSGNTEKSFRATPAKYENEG
jgi:peptidyl serine alpha-galactosyltransferase